MTDVPTPPLLQRNWLWLVLLGALLMIMGALAILAPVLSSIAVNAWIGAVFVLAGIGQAAQAWQSKGWKGGLGHLGIGLVYVAGGLLILFDPLAGLMAFTLIVAFALTVTGVMRLWTGLRMRPEDGWGWITAAGVVALLAAFAIYMAFPGAALWLLGFLAGINFLIEGAAVFAIGWAARGV